MRRRFEPAGGLKGRVVPPPDKSISHRAALLGAMCDEPVPIENYLYAEDTLSTLDALRSLGAGVEPQGDSSLLVRGVGLRTAAPTTGGLLNVHNSGTLLPARGCDWHKDAPTRPWPNSRRCTSSTAAKRGA